MFFDFTVDETRIDEATERIRDYANGMDLAFRSAFDESLQTSERATQRSIRTHVNIEASENPFIQTEVAIREKLLAREGNLKLIDRSIPLRAFKARQTPEGVEVDTVRGGHQKFFYKSAFGPKIAKLNGNIYRRAGKARFPLIKQVDLKVSQIEGVSPRFNEQVAKYKEIMLRRLEKEKAKLNQQYGRGAYNAIA